MSAIDKWFEQKPSQGELKAEYERLSEEWKATDELIRQHMDRASNLRARMVVLDAALRSGPVLTPPRAVVEAGGALPLSPASTTPAQEKKKPDCYRKINEMIIDETGELMCPQECVGFKGCLAKLKRESKK